MPQDQHRENPYTALLSQFDSETYYGSSYWVETLIAAVSRTPPQAREYFGLPGMGKTTLLRYIADPQGALIHNVEYLREPFRTNPLKLMCVLVEYRAAPQDLDPFVYLYGRFVSDFNEYRKTIRALRPSQSLPDVGNHEALDNATAAKAMSEALTALARVEIRPVLLLDDFDLAFERLDLSEATAMRPWRDYASMVLVTERLLGDVNSKAAGSPFYQTIGTQRMDGLNRDESARLITRPADLAGSPFPEGDVESVLSMAGGHPLLLILASEALWQLREEQGLLNYQVSPLDRAHLFELRERCRVAFQFVFDRYLEHLNSQERSALKRLLVNRPSATTGDTDVITSLQEKGIVTWLHNEFVLFSPLFGEYVHKTST